MQEADVIRESWDKKKIALAVLAIVGLLGIGYGAKTLVLDAQKSKEPVVSKLPYKTVEGINTQSEEVMPRVSPSPVASGSASTVVSVIQEKIDTLKQQVLGINPADIASSSPQVQKVLNDIKALETYPKNQAKELCAKVCSAF